MEIIVNNPGELPAAARKLIPLLNGAGVVALYGGMGAGKTTLVSALMREMGSSDDVSSPTFALVNDYVSGEGRRIHHFDFYRIDDVREAFDLGYEEYFYSGELCLVEWPEKIEDLLPDDTLRIRIETLSDGSRSISTD